MQNNIMADIYNHFSYVFFQKKSIF